MMTDVDKVHVVRSTAVLALAVTMFASVAYATHNEPAKWARKARSDLVSGYRKCTAGTMCVGPVRHPDDPDWQSRDCSSTDCGVTPSCLRACPTATKNDPDCSLLDDGTGFIEVAKRGNDLRVRADVRGISPACIGEATDVPCSLRSDCDGLAPLGSQYQCIDSVCRRSLHLGVNGLVRMSADDCPIGASDPACTLQDRHQYTNFGIAFCEVEIRGGKGRCKIDTTIKQAIAGAAPRQWCPMRYPSGKVAGLEILVGGLQRCTRVPFDYPFGGPACEQPIIPPAPIGARFQCQFHPAFGPAMQAGVLVGKPREGSAIDGPKRAQTATAELVTGYRQCVVTSATGSRESTSFGDKWLGCVEPPKRNDPECGFGVDGSGTALARVVKSDVKITITAQGLDCVGATLCLSSSDLIVTDAYGCRGPADVGACTVEDRPDRLTGRGDWSLGEEARTGCSVVQPDGSFSIVTSLNSLSPDLIESGFVSSGAFFRTGLLRVNASDGTRAKVNDIEVGPAFVVGLFSP